MKWRDRWRVRRVLAAGRRRDRRAPIGHQVGCPAGPALVPVAAIGRATIDHDSIAYRPWPHVWHPPTPCSACGAPIVVAHRDQRSKSGRVWCSPTHKAADWLAEVATNRDRAGAYAAAWEFNAALLAQARADADRAARDLATALVRCPHPFKLRFVDADGAAAAFADLMAIDPELLPYPCVCGVWHVGHPPTTERKLRRSVGDKVVPTVATSARIDPRVLSLFDQPASLNPEENDLS